MLYNIYIYIHIYIYISQSSLFQISDLLNGYGRIVNRIRFTDNNFPNLLG